MQSNRSPVQLRRRDFLRGTAAAGLAPVAFSALAAKAFGSAAQTSPLRARARRVIFVFMHGGPSQIDTFDHKPLLDRYHGKPLPYAKPKVVFAKTGNLMRSPFEFRRYGESGHLVSDLFPHVGKQIDKICQLRSIHGSNPAHGGACMAMQTGSANFVRPSMGSWILYGLGSESENLPGFVTIDPRGHCGHRNYSSAFLPAQYQGVPLRGGRFPHVPASRSEEDVREQASQLDLLREIETSRTASNPNSRLDARLSSFELAFRMQASAPDLADLSGEPEGVRKLYGFDQKPTQRFAKQCLLARRLAERGVRFIQVSHGYWDQHGNLEKDHRRLAAEVDRPIAGLLQDLDDRGMLDDTLVIWGGEFGRTPCVQGNIANGSAGRDHNPHGYTMWMAGGGVKGGHVHGASDDFGWYAESDKMHLHDFHATLLHLLGLDHEKLTYRHAGRDFRLTDVSGTVATSILA
ncbi:MAG: DUF1501 domain-containing protein [Planctomycetota bacterium]